MDRYVDKDKTLQTAVQATSVSFHVCGYQMSRV